MFNREFQRILQLAMHRIIMDRHQVFGALGHLASQDTEIYSPSLYGPGLLCTFAGGKRKKEKKGTEQLAKVIECAQARYEVQDVELGKVYKWRPERIVIECLCGQRLSLTASKTTCVECGTDHELAVKEALTEGHQSDQILHPWRYYYSEDREGASLPF
jgi:hypothetical protein